MWGVGYFGSEKQKGGSKFAVSRGTFWLAVGLIFQWWFGFRRKKSPLLAFYGPILSYFNSLFSKSSPPFSENNMVNAVKKVIDK